MAHFNQHQKIAEQYGMADAEKKLSDNDLMKLKNAQNEMQRNIIAQDKLNREKYGIKVKNR